MQCHGRRSGRQSSAESERVFQSGRKMLLTMEWRDRLGFGTPTLMSRKLGKDSVESVEMDDVDVEAKEVEVGLFTSWGMWNRAGM